MKSIDVEKLPDDIWKLVSLVSYDNVIREAFGISFTTAVY